MTYHIFFSACQVCWLWSLIHGRAPTFYERSCTIFLWRDRQPVLSRKATVNSCHSGRLTPLLILPESVFSVIIHAISSDICIYIFCQIKPQIFSVKISFKTHYSSRLCGAGSHRHVGGFDFCWINLDVKCWSSHTIAAVSSGRNVGVGCFRGSSCSLLFFKQTDADWLLMALSHANIQPKPPQHGLIPYMVHAESLCHSQYSIILSWKIHCFLWQFDFDTLHIHIFNRGV